MPNSSEYGTTTAPEVTYTWPVTTSTAKVAPDLAFSFFERIAEGWGYRRTAHGANAAGLSASKPRRKNNDGTPAVAGWSPSTVRDVVNRDLYRGVRVWGRRKKRDSWDQKRPTVQPKDDWEIIPAEHLRVVSDDLWRRAHGRLRASREAYPGPTTVWPTSSVGPPYAPTTGTLSSTAWTTWS
jgi:hypothetical protein